MERFGAPFVVFDRSKMAQNGPKKKKNENNLHFFAKIFGL